VFNEDYKVGLGFCDVLPLSDMFFGYLWWGFAGERLNSVLCVEWAFG
jgi:hypothetical protein